MFLPPGLTQKSNTCGMHVHLTKDAFTKGHLYRFLLFFNENRVNVANIAERDYNRYCQFTGKEALKAKSEGRSGGKYEDVNVSKPHTVEVRVFAGVLDKDSLFKNLEFCDAVFYFTQGNEIEECSDWELFTKYVADRKERYTYLHKYIEEEGWKKVNAVREKKPPTFEELLVNTAPPLPRRATRISTLPSTFTWPASREVDVESSSDEL
jgi:hypothetical protein